MPRYFFNVVDEQSLADSDGLDLADMAAARSMAIQTAGAMLQDAGRAQWNGSEWQMRVTTDRKTVLSLNFSAVESA